MPSADPIFQENGYWYFWDEIWANKIGPYLTQTIAREHLAEYVRFLDGQTHQWDSKSTSN